MQSKNIYTVQSCLRVPVVFTRANLGLVQVVMLADIFIWTVINTRLFDQFGPVVKELVKVFGNIVVKYIQGLLKLTWNISADGRVSLSETLNIRL